MKRYDMHIHINSDVIDRGYLLEKMEESGIWGGGLISLCPEEVEADLPKLPYRQRLENLLKWTQEDDRLIPIMWVHPREKNACDVVADAAASGVRAFKMICDNYAVDSPESMKLLGAIEKSGRPVLFHSGILWAGMDSSKYNRPVNWECMLHFPEIKFALAHCAWPWYDECIAVYGKFLNSCLHRQSSEMFFDLTPGTPEIYRKDMLTKLWRTGYDVQENVMFGTDSLSDDYNPSWVKGWIERDDAIYDELGINQQQREKIYSENFLRMIEGRPIHHLLPQPNKK